MISDLLDPNPFANPLFAEKGDRVARDIYTDVGFALDRWEHCEISFAVLYSALINPSDGNHIVLRAFGTLAAASARHDMIKAACDALFGTHANAELNAETRHLLNLYKSASARRNEIAHAMVMGDMTVFTDPLPPSGLSIRSGWFLVPPMTATRKNKLHHQGTTYRYTTKELSHFTKCFEELGSRAGKLAQRINQFHQRRRESPSQQHLPHDSE